MGSAPSPKPAKDPSPHVPSAAMQEQAREQLRAFMAKQGLRSTDQRRIIVDTFLASGEHVSIEELLGLVRARDPRVGYATVYRTLKLLAECGIANERQFGDGLTRYELADASSHHDHLICTVCNGITEFEDDRVEEIQEEIAARHGFRLRSHKHELYGVCASCQSRGA